MGPIYRITVREIFKLSYLWYINIFGLVAAETLPAFGLFHFGSSMAGVLEILQSCLFFTIFISVLTVCYTLFGKELYYKMALTLFTKPVSRTTILIAKYFALISVISVCVLTQGLWLMKQIIYLGWNVQQIILALAAIWNVFLLGGMLLSLALAFTLYIGPLAAVFLTVIATVTSFLLPETALYIASPLIPAIPWMDLNAMIYKNIPLTFKYFSSQTLYAVAYSSWMLFLCSERLKRLQF